MSSDDGRRRPGDSLSMWTVYDHPADFPDTYVAREWILPGGGPSAVVITENVIVSKSLDVIRTKLMEKGLIPMNRERDDDPKIMETWI